MSTEHTPGPWELVIGAGSQGYAGNYEIMSAISIEHEANARLIAAAPDLLETSEKMFRSLAAFLDHAPVNLRVQCYAPIHALEQARAAIAKAKGGQG